MRPILIAREGLSTIVLIENGNDEDAWKGAGRVPNTANMVFVRAFFVANAPHVGDSGGLPMAALELKAPLGTGLCALRPEENFF